MMKWIGLAAFVVMLAMISYGFVAGDGFTTEGGLLLDLAWGRVTIVDLYVALAIIGAWIVRREGWRRAIPWLAGLVIGGSLTAGLYLVTTSRGSRFAFPPSEH